MPYLRMGDEQNNVHILAIPVWNPLTLTVYLAAHVQCQYVSDRDNIYDALPRFFVWLMAQLISAFWQQGISGKHLTEKLACLKLHL